MVRNGEVSLLIDERLLLLPHHVLSMLIACGYLGRSIDFIGVLILHVQGLIASVLVTTCRLA